MAIFDPFFDRSWPGPERGTKPRSIEMALFGQDPQKRGQKRGPKMGPWDPKKVHFWSKKGSKKGVKIGVIFGPKMGQKTA